MIKALMTIGKFVAGIGGLATIIWAGFTFYDRVMDRFDDLEYGIGDNTEMVNEALKVAKENRDSLEVLVERQDEQDQNMVEMRSAMQFYFHNQKEYTAEQMSILMEQLLSSQKKNSLPMGEPVDPTGLRHLRYGQREYDIIFTPIDTIPYE